MSPEVHFDLAGLTEALPAHGARIRFFPGVHPDVHFEVAVLVEALAAELAAERPLPRVQPLVLLQLAQRAEGGVLGRQVVGVDVVAQGRVVVFAEGGICRILRRVMCFICLQGDVWI